MNPKAFSTTIKRKYFDMKMQDHDVGGYFVEYKEDNKFWGKRLAGLKIPCRGTFLIGREWASFWITEIKKIPISKVPPRYRELLGTIEVYAIKCGLKLGCSCIDQTIGHKCGNRPDLKRSGKAAINGPVKDERLKDGDAQ